MSKKFNQFKRKSKKIAKNKKTISFFYIFLLVFLTLVIIFNVSDIFSSIITNQKSVFYVEKLEYNSFSVYGVSLKHFDTYEDANEYATQVQLNGAMGSVYQSGEYYVLANIYPTLIEAQEIKENLKLLNYDARILNFKFQNVLTDFKGKNLNIVISCLEQFKDTIYQLYSVGLDYDKGQLTTSNLNGKLAILCDKIDKTKKLYDKEINTFEFKNKQEISNNLNKLYLNVENLILCNKENLQLSSYIKQVLFNVVIFSQNIFQNLS